MGDGKQCRASNARAIGLVSYFVIAEGGEGWSNTHNWSKGFGAFGVELLLVSAFGKAGKAAEVVDSGTGTATKAVREVGENTTNVTKKVDGFHNEDVWKAPLSGSIMDRLWRKAFEELKKTFDGKVIKKLDEVRIDLDTGKKVHGSYNPTTNEITLYKGADDATFFHELLHWEDVEEFLKRGGVTRDWIQSLKPDVWKKAYESGEARIAKKLYEYGFTPAK